MGIAPRHGAFAAATVLAASVFAAAAALPQGAPKLSGFGDTHRAVATRAPAAQAWFDQGIRQAYAFDEAEAVRAFKAALAADPSCAMCAWGVAWQLGPNFNHPRHADMPEARRYALLAHQLLDNSTPAAERALVDAMVARYSVAQQAFAMPAAPVPDVCGRPAGNGADPLDLAYAQQMRVLADAEPDDPDLQSLFAEAELLAAPGPTYDPATLRTYPRFVALIQRLEAALRANPRHIGLIHYLIHAADTPADAGRALATAATLQRLAPDAPHLVHMPAHLYVRLGRYADAVRANQLALAAQVRLSENLKQQGFSLLTDWNAHNRRFLWIAAQLQGDRQTAMREARELADSAGARTDDWSKFLRSMPLLTMVHFEQWADVLDATRSPADTSRLAPNVLAHARGWALLRTGHADEAEPDLRALEQMGAEALAKGPQAKAGAAFAALLLAPLKAEQALGRGDKASAQSELRKAVAIEPDFGAQEPPLWAASAQRNLGQGLLRMRDFRGAEAAFRADLAQWPGNSGALRGLHQALLAQGRKQEAAR